MRPSIVLLAVAGCGGPAPADLPAAIPGTQVRMDFSRASSLYAAPVPSDDILAAGGRGLSAHPNPDAMSTVDQVLEVLADAAGFGTTTGTFFALDGAVDVAIDPHASLASDAPVFLVQVGGADVGRRIPVDVRYEADGGPYGAPHLLSLLPVQGIPLAPRAPHAAVVLRALGDAAGEPLGVSATMAAIAAGQRPAELPVTVWPTWQAALAVLREEGVDLAEVAGLTVFTTADPVAGLAAGVEAARALPVPEPAAPAELTDVYEAFCVFEGLLDMPVFQEGEPPYDDGGGWVMGEDGAPLLQGWAASRFWVTVPRAAPPAAGWPVAVMVRTGGGGDRPLVDRGVRDADGVSEPGTGPARVFAAAGFAGFMVDGPHGGPRNPTGADEQFLMFNITNLFATRDNVRQTALELALVPEILDRLRFDAAACPDAGDFVADGAHLALMGHSMGATVAPLTLAVTPRFGAVILSGAGGSYIHNLVYKESPLPVRPLAEAMLGYAVRGRVLTEHDPFLSVFQWAAEPADPPPYAARVDGVSVLMLQGIVDTYILPPMANASTLGLGLDLAGPALDRDHPELQAFTPVADLLDLVGGAPVALPAAANRGAVTAVVVQHPEDAVEDGHEVMFQTEAPQHQVRCFLEGFAADRPPRVPVGGAVGDPCG